MAAQISNLPLTRVDSVLIAYTDFEPSFNNWLSVLVGTLNEDYSLIEAFANSFIRGTVTLVAGTATVNTSLINTGNSIFLNMTTAVNPGFITTSIIDGVSFTIQSSNVLDASTFSYMIVKI